MLVIVDDPKFGEMVCNWQNEAARQQVRHFLLGMFHRFVKHFESQGTVESPNDAEIQRELDELMVKADSLFEEYAPAFFFEAQARLAFDVVLKLADDVLQNTQIKYVTNDQQATVISIAQIADMQPLRELRKTMSQVFKTRHNELLGIRRGREAGKKDRRPRMRRATNADRRNKILRAMREIGQAPFSRSEVASRIGITTKTLRKWVSKEEWEYLTVEALSTGT